MTSKKFTSFRQYAAALRQAATLTPTVKKIALEMIGQLVTEIAQSKFGHYQHLWTPWLSLAPETQADRIRRGYRPDDPLLVTGELKKSVEYYVLGNTVHVGSSNQLMLYHELGTCYIPPRPVIGPAMFQAQLKIKQICEQAIFAVVTGRINEFEKIKLTSFNAQLLTEL